MRKRKYFTPSRPFGNRDFSDPQYEEWRAYIRKRDGCRCQMPMCGKIGQHCHHIQKWANFPVLRYDKNNGIFLCSACHKKIKGQEETYAALFMQIVGKNSVAYAAKLERKKKCRN